MESDLKIPIVDLEPYYSSTPEENDKKRQVAEEICDAFRKIGFVYLKNHKISEETTEAVYSSARKFFKLPAELKLKYERKGGSYQGYIVKERTDPGSPVDDSREAVNLPANGAEQFCPEEVPEYKPAILNMIEGCKKLSQDVLLLLGIGLKLEDPEYFVKRHREDGANSTTIKTAYYPEIWKDIAKPGQIRLGEHADIGSITILFQDDAGGLEVKTRDGDFIPATPIPGTAIVNIGNILQVWTSDQLISTRHRIGMPVERSTGKERQSIIFFVNPNDDSLIECIDGSNKYEPIKTKDFLWQQYVKIMGDRA